MSEIDDSRAPLMEHLVELRKRLIWSFGALLLAFALCFYFAGEIFSFLVQPLIAGFGGPGEGRIVYTKLYEAFFTEVRVALFAAFMVAFPVIANQIWAFVAPGLYVKEKRAFLPFLIATPVLFTLGAALAYYVVMPTAIASSSDIRARSRYRAGSAAARGEYLSS
jgi:sec-independent protein translocase protein TatC